MDPWSTPLFVVRGTSHAAAERRAISRDRERGTVTRVRQGVSVPTAEWDAGTGPAQERARHIIRARALAAVVHEPPVFSHWTAAVLQDLPIIDAALDRVHVTEVTARKRGIDGVLPHAFPVRREELVLRGGLLMTGVPRTVVDIAGAAPFLGGVVVANGALFSGVPRILLEQAADLAGPRRASSRIADVIAIGHPGAETAAESASYVSMFRLGFEPLHLQHEIWDEQGLAGVLDGYHPGLRIGTEVDGLRKYLDPAMAPQGAGRAVVKEKQREDRMRRGLRALAHYGYWEAKEPFRLRPILASVGLRPPANRPTLDDWAAVARDARPRLRR